MLLVQDEGLGGGRLGPGAGTAAAADSIPSHPLGIKPLGNQYFSSGRNARSSLGTLGGLPDEMLLHFLDYVDPSSLRLLGHTCRFLFAFCRLDDLWKSHFLESSRAQSHAISWRGSWRATYLNMPDECQAKIDGSDVYSDVLHRPFVCSHILLSKHIAHIPRSNEITRLETLTYDDFSTQWSKTPFLLTRCIQEWPVFQEWDLQRIQTQYSHVPFRAEAVDWEYSTYSEYMANSRDESPLYLFDKKFAEKMGIRVGHGDGCAYWAPECFGPDLFELLGDERPAHRWLIAGPERSGSTFHKDPNGTSAWNAVIEGSKYWIMFPPSAQVPGVYVSEDSSEVTSPLSIAEWLLEFHREARATPGCIEGICKAGEILHVPSGWWHLVVNLEPGVALTQNFVPKSHLGDVLYFLREKADQVTGFAKEIESPFDLFVERLKAREPELLEEALEELELRSQRRKRKWEEAVGDKDGSENGGGGFSFGFGGDDLDEIP